MPTLQIDNQTIEVPAGATLLEAAEALGIEVPTLCFLKGYEPSTSCLVCMVKDSERGQFLPSCATVAVDGMQIESETAEVHEVRKTALELLLSDHVGDCVAPCHFACPAHMDIPLMLRQIGRSDLTNAIATIKEDIALPAILGRVCPKPCEKGCRRSSGDGPVAVCELKRHVADEDLKLDDPYLPTKEPSSGRRVAVVGAGPAGLAATFHLLRAGHAVTLFEKEAEPGGRLRTDWGEDELPRDTLAGELAQIIRLGPETRFGTTLGDDVTLNEIQQQYDAVLLAIGKTSAETIEQWGFVAGSRGVTVDKATMQTNLPGVFAAGNILRGKGLVVRSVADGKEAAGAIDDFVRGIPITPIKREFSVRMGKIDADEMQQFRQLASDSVPRKDDPADEPAIEEAAADQSDRCLACGCRAHGNCKLERYSAMYGADPNRYRGERRPFVQHVQHSSVVYEPGKCINCELCIQIAGQAKETLGLSFVGRGFDVRVGVPFDGTMEDALGEVAAKCVAACPTAAISFRQFADACQSCASE